ncbi:MAG TPA: serine hydrolase [Solimonas sp.]|nr:serine hydrolase [Solimonas sp.]
MRKGMGMVVAALLLAGCGGRSEAPGQPDDGLSGPKQLCTTPAGDWQRLDPAALELDAAKLQDALDWANLHTGLSVAVYRHGCMAMQSRLDSMTANVPLDGWSMTKTVVALLVGRAVTLGLVKLDEPIGRFYPEADAEHARLTLRQLMTETAGMQVNYLRELNPAMPDRVQDALSLPFEHEPGSTWEYAQTVVDLTLNVVERAAGRDVQEFAQQELFDPLGIQQGAYIWQRDRAGNSLGYAHLWMRNQDWAKLGHLMLWGGQWNGQRLISTDYLRQMRTRVPDNPAYGFLVWLNGGGWWRVPAVEGPDSGEGSVIPSGPDDLYAFVGIGEQRIWIIPSLDLVIVRTGERGSQELDTRVTAFSGRAGQIDWEIPRRVLLAVKDAGYVDPGPYQSAGLVLPPADDGIIGDAFELQQVMAGLGLGPLSPEACSLFGCTAP